MENIYVVHLKRKKKLNEYQVGTLNETGKNEKGTKIIITKILIGHSK